MLSAQDFMRKHLSHRRSLRSISVSQSLVGVGGVFRKVMYEDEVRNAQQFINTI